MSQWTYFVIWIFCYISHKSTDPRGGIVLANGSGSPQFHRRQVSWLDLTTWFWNFRGKAKELVRWKGEMELREMGRGQCGVTWTVARNYHQDVGSSRSSNAPILGLPWNKRETQLIAHTLLHPEYKFWDTRIMPRRDWNSE